MEKHGTAPVNSGLFAEYASAVIRQLPRDVDPKVAQHWIEHQAELAGVLRQALDWNIVPGVGITWPVTVNYDSSLENMIKAGKYDWSDHLINTENFPYTKGPSELSIELVQLDPFSELVQFNRFMDSEKILRELDKEGLRPATLPELLAFGEKYPKMQREFPIVALGSVWHRHSGCNGNEPYAPFLCGDSSSRTLTRSYIEDGWPVNHRFAAVRK